MDPQFQELAAQITRDVTEAVKKEVTETLKDHVSEVVSAAERRLAEHTRSTLDAAERRLTEHARSTLDASERRLSEQARINVEAVRAETSLAAEGYGGVLDSINLRLTSIDDRLTKQATRYDVVLANHNERITALEHGKPPTVA